VHTVIMDSMLGSVGVVWKYVRFLVVEFLFLWAIAGVIV
jgi:hypothetical protein